MYNKKTKIFKGLTANIILVKLTYSKSHFSVSKEDDNLEPKCLGVVKTSCRTFKAHEVSERFIENNIQNERYSLNYGLPREARN